MPIQEGKDSDRLSIYKRSLEGIRLRLSSIYVQEEAGWDRIEAELYLCTRGLRYSLLTFLVHAEN